MERNGQPEISGCTQQALDEYGQMPQQFEDLSPVTIFDYLSDLRQFIRKSST